MAAPTPTVRQAPVLPRLEDGHVSLMTFSQDPNIDLYEISVQAPGVDNGDKIDTTTQWNEQ